MTKDKVGFRMWMVFILIGLVGQFAWAIENMYLNSYIAYLNFSSIESERFDYSLLISITTAVSAIMATLTTIFMGALTDKVGHKKLFISLGYILWGISTACFGLLNVNSSDGKTLSITPFLAAVFVIVFDLIMTFFGSTSNDASFNSYVTEKTSDSNRGKVESVLSIMPLIAMIIIFVGLNSLTTKENGYRWDLFFYIVGGIVILVGIIAIFLIPSSKDRMDNLTTSLLKNDDKVTSLISEGFKIKTIKENKKLYLILSIYFIFATACQVFFPYIMIYVEKTCNISNTSASFLTDFALVMAISLLGGSLLSLIFGFLADKYGKDKMIIPTILIFAIGSIMMYFIPQINNTRIIYATISTLIMILGYVAVPTILNSLVREYIPKGKEGSFLGVRMIFVVLLPMCIGPFIGNYLNTFKPSYKDEFGIETKLPSELAYIVGASILILVIIPLCFYFKMRKKENEKE